MASKSESYSLFTFFKDCLQSLNNSQVSNAEEFSEKPKKNKIFVVFYGPSIQLYDNGRFNLFVALKESFFLTFIFCC